MAECTKWYSHFFKSKQTNQKQQQQQQNQTNKENDILKLP